MRGQYVVVLMVGLLAAVLSLGGCDRPQEVEKGASLATPELLEKHCRDVVGPPRVEKISEHVWAAIGYDLASTVLIHTLEGNVIVDTAISPPKAKEIRAALEAEAPKGPVKAVIFTHSHIDHVGGATVWSGEGVPIWATAVLPGHLLKQYALYLPIETIRGSRQFGRNVPSSKVPCSALGPRPDFDLMGESGMLLPTETFSGQKVLTIGGLTIELVEAHGETHDQLFVWIPEDDTVIAGDNFYWSFPNLYTLRGTSPRPVDDWIESVDKIRRRNPAHLVPNHTKPIHGKEKIAEILTNYRDSIQWVRDEVVRGANKGLDVDTLAETIKLPKHLAEKHYNKEFYGQVDWSVRAIYTNNLGWFDGRADKLYPLPQQEVAAREVELLGGVDKVMSLADEVVEGGDLRWAIHLLAKMEDSGLARGAAASRLTEKLALCYEGLAEGIYNTNGRAYLLQTAVELRRGPSKTDRAVPPEGLVARIPLENIFFILGSKLIPEKAMDVHESMQFVFPDEDKRFTITVRRGIAEVVEGDPLPGTPDPVAVLTFDSLDFRKMIFKMVRPAGLWAKGKITAEGSWVDALKFLGRFDTSA
jgi:alkyl sulfatase BDS1-like metallo-beta-lactamase superfamily hydrolase